MTTTEIVETLESIRSAVADQQRATATELFAELGTRYDDAASAEAFRRQRFLLVRDRGGVSPDQQEALIQYLTTATRVQARRGSLLITAARYTSGQDVDRESFLSGIETTKNIEETLLEERDAAESVEVSDPLPALVALTDFSTPIDPIPKGQSRELSVVVGNAGDTEATEVSVELSADGSVALDPETATLGTVADSTSVSVSVTGTKAGEFQVTANLSSAGDGSDFESGSVEVIGAIEAIRIAREHVANALDKVPSGGRGGGGRGQSLRAKLSNADKKLEDAVEFAEQGQSRQTDNALRAASQILGALLNQLDASGQEIENSFALRQQAEAAIDAIGTGRAAKI